MQKSWWHRCEDRTTKMPPGCIRVLLESLQRDKAVSQAPRDSRVCLGWGRPGETPLLLFSLSGLARSSDINGDAVDPGHFC